MPKLKQNKLGLLLAEDDEKLGQILEIEFRERNFEVTWVRSIRELKETGSTNNFGYAIVDLRLGSDSGLDLVTCLKKKSEETGHSIRMVVLTGYGSIPTAVEAVKRGANHYLTKPASVDAIEGALLGTTQESVPEGNAETLAQHERGFIEAVLLQEDGNITHAAKRLGIRRQSLQRKMRKFTPNS